MLIEGYAAKGGKARPAIVNGGKGGKSWRPASAPLQPRITRPPNPAASASWSSIQPASSSKPAVAPRVIGAVAPRVIGAVDPPRKLAQSKIVQARPVISHVQVQPVISHVRVRPAIIRRASPATSSLSSSSAAASGTGLASLQQVQGNASEVLHNAVWEATAPIKHLENQWGHDELVKRIVKYFTKAITPGMLKMAFREAAKTFVDGAMVGLSAACGDKPWFFELNFSAPLAVATWEIVKVSPVMPRANFPECERCVTEQYTAVMDKVLLDKAMYQAVQISFDDERTRSKIYKALSNAHETAHATAKAATGDLEDLDRVEVFLKEWMVNSMGRAWQAIDNSETVLDPAGITMLFGNLIAPFGEEHPFSCVPSALTENIGRPPHTWPVIEELAEEAYGDWYNSFPEKKPDAVDAGDESATKRRRIDKGKGLGKGCKKGKGGKAGKGPKGGKHSKKGDNVEDEVVDGIDDALLDDAFLEDGEDALLAAVLTQAAASAGEFGDDDEFGDEA